jgi:predicted oxidoreductase (fatty acid repression mutant protein)
MSGRSQTVRRLAALALVLGLIMWHGGPAAAQSFFSVSPKVQRACGVGAGPEECLITVNISRDPASGPYQILVENEDTSFKKQFEFLNDGPLEQSFRVMEKASASALLLYSGLIDGLPVTDEEEDQQVVDGKVDVDALATGLGLEPGYTVVVEVSAFHDQTIDLKYDVVTKSVQIDSLEPKVTQVRPRKYAVGMVGTFAFDARVTDLDSAFAEDSEDLNTTPEHGGITLVLKQTKIASDGITCRTSPILAQLEVEVAQWTKITDGWRLRASVPLGKEDEKQCYRWFVEATDAAGNSKSAWRFLKVDGEKPTIAIAATGHWSDPTLTGQGRVRDGCDARPTSLRVNFTDFIGLDVGTVEPGDFTVNNVTPSAVLVVDLNDEALDSNEPESPRDVFLTLPAELSSDSKAQVRIVGEIRDRAGNLSELRVLKASQDGLPPNITVTLSSALNRESVTITIVSDEDLDQQPAVQLRAQDTAAGELELANPADPTVTSTARRTYQVTVDAEDDPRPDEARRINVLVTTRDPIWLHGPATGQVGTPDCTAGNATNAEGQEAITFELDPLLNGGFDPEFSVAGNRIIDGSFQKSNGEADVLARIQTVDPLLVTVDFGRQCGRGADPDNSGVTKCFSGPGNSGEKEEYLGDTHETVELTRISAEVTLSNGDKKSLPVTLAGSDGVRFSLSLPGSDLGEYVVKVRARDEAGNVSKSPHSTVAQTMEARFTIVKAEPFEISLSPGWNLISLPFTPTDVRLNQVIPPGHPISLVLGYDPAREAWSVSRRDPDTGLFEGDVATMTATTGYFVLTDSFQSVEILRRTGGGGERHRGMVRPWLGLRKGWNLIPVLSNASPPVPIVADEYLSATEWVKALTYDPLTRVWLTIEAGDVQKPKLKVGRAYWVWTREEGTIVP